VPVGREATGRPPRSDGILNVGRTIAHHAWRFLLVAPGLFYLFYALEIVAGGKIPAGADLSWWMTGLVAAYIFSSIPVLIIATLVGATAHKFPRFNAVFYSILLFEMARLSLAVLSDMGRMFDLTLGDYFFTIRGVWIHIPAAIVGAVCACISYPRRPPSVSDLADRFS
jgi:hypothetical protein